MRDAIARALCWVLDLLIPCAPGRHSAEYLAARAAAVPEPVPVSPWSRPWTAPSAQDVRAVFGDAWTQGLPEAQRERVWAAEFAVLGVDYDFPAASLGSLVR